MQRMVFNSMGLDRIPFMSPSAENAYQGMSQRLRLQAWNSILSSDILWKCRCKLFPYEKNPGEVKRVLATCVDEMKRCLETKGHVERALRECIHRFMEVPVEKPGSKPLVGIVGEIYVRSNPFCNDYLTDAIERMGGEAWLAPLSEWMIYTAEMQAWMASQRLFNIGEKLDAYVKNRFMHEREHRYYEMAKPLLHDRIEPTVKEVIKAGERFVPINFQGEAILTLGRAQIFCTSGAQLVVNAAPFGCMPGTITSALVRQVQTETGVPIVSMFYDGKEGQNERLEVFFNNLCSRTRDT
jgi:predicted nucleotide-binding protein (sugar kinase/HSP70/actin superfamily)